jgi:hypothetical protein
VWRAGWQALCMAFGFAILGMGSGEANASTLFMCSGSPNEQQVGVDTNNPNMHVPLCMSKPAAPGGGEVADGGRRDITPYRPPGYKPPPRPKGWQRLWTGFTEFVAGIDRSGSAAERLTHDYVLAMNYPGEAEARAAAEAMCRHRVLQARSTEAYVKNHYGDADGYCREHTRVLDEPFVRLGVAPTGRISVNHHVNAVLAANVSRKIGHRSYNCSSDEARTPELCNYWVLAVFPNGRHERPPVTGFDHVFACPNGPASAQYKVIGVDRKSGLFVPLCGPDLARWK